MLHKYEMRKEEKEQRIIHLKTLDVSHLHS